VCGALLLGACSVSGDAAGGSPTRDDAASPSVAAHGTCPPAGEGTCSGELQPGTAQRSESFRPQVTFEVPEPGWVNAEDYPGNYALVPPGGTIAGINAETSDFIGLATSVAPSRLRRPAGCRFAPVPGPWTPVTMAKHLADQPGVSARGPRPTSLGGLTGVVLDLRADREAPLTTCTVDGRTFAFTAPFSGRPPTFLDHAVAPGRTMRLYLLAYRRGVLGVELTDVDSAGGGLADLEAVTRTLHFDR
jgi:hypothetical protein